MVGLPAGDETLVPALSREGFRDRPSRNFKSILMKANHPRTDWQCHLKCVLWNHGSFQDIQSVKS